jgi:hypothetical protein
MKARQTGGWVDRRTDVKTDKQMRFRDNGIERSITRQTDFFECMLGKIDN